MTLQKAVFFAGIAAYAGFMLTALTVLIGVAINAFGLPKIDVSIAAPIMAACLVFRLVFALWLKWLGGAPAEFKPK